jgi:hypothetical protein
MSILDQTDNLGTPDFSQLAADRLVQMARMSYQQMAQAYNQGARIFWQNPNGVTPTQIAEKLGNKAAEVFTLHYLLGQLLAGVKPESIAEGAALIGTATLNEDGTVTIPTPEPTPE